MNVLRECYLVFCPENGEQETRHVEYSPGGLLWNRPSAGFSGMLGRIRRRQELRAAQNKARSGKVTLARQYRAGELPDIQSITIQSFLAPLGEPCLLRAAHLLLADSS